VMVLGKRLAGGIWAARDTFLTNRRKKGH